MEPIPDGCVKKSLHTLHLLYHELRLEQSGYSYAMSKPEFERHVDLMIGLRSAGTCGLWPELTFDDGHLSDFDHALPILQSRGLTAQFFITAGWTGRKANYMGWDELRSLHEAGQSIGAHGWSHVLLTHCAKSDLDQELRRSRLHLEDKLGTSVTTMSLPGGRYNRRVLAACREAGYSRVFTSEPKAEPSEFTIGRLNIRGDMSSEWIRQLLQPGSSVLSSLERQYKIKHAAQSLLGDRLYDKAWSIVNRKEPRDVDGGRDAG